MGVRLDDRRFYQARPRTEVARAELRGRRLRSLAEGAVFSAALVALLAFLEIAALVAAGVPQ